MSTSVSDHPRIAANAQPAPSAEVPAGLGDVSIEPCRDADQLRAYIDANWRAGHVLARDEAVFRFTYMTPWVDRRNFPKGISALGAYRGDRLVGFLGAIVAPYPRARSFWLALWHVMPELKGSGAGGELLKRMQQIALGDGPEPMGWIGTFGAGPEALPVYLKRGYVVRGARRWLYEPTPNPGPSRPHRLQPGECEPDGTWLRHRFANHPSFQYDVLPGGVYRTEDNAWGRVTHVCRLGADWFHSTRQVYEREHAIAQRAGRPFLLDAWSFDCPGNGWTVAPSDLPSVFHPPQARGNITFAVGLPFVPSRIHKGDCDQDRPNLVEQLRVVHSAA